MTAAEVDRLEVEILRVNRVSQSMLHAYAAWSQHIETGEMQQWMYNEIIDFVNFRMETAETCLLLIVNERIADALGLCRSLLENYLLLMLQCRGRKFFKLHDRSDLTEGPFKKFLAERQQENEEQRAAGKKAWLEIRKYPRAKRHLMYVGEGLENTDDPDLVVPAHYFHFKNFSPEVMRLKVDDYFEYYARADEVREALRKHQQDVTQLYRHYLSYDALLQCLELNDLADTEAVKRIEAHYTFLGRFLHPTNDAARNLRVGSNHHSGASEIGMAQPYTKEARLLASLYVCYLVAGIIDEVAGLLEAAPKRHIRESGTRAMRGLTATVPVAFPYFWFLYNEAPLYDKYNYCTHHISEEELVELGHYSKLASGRVPFEKDVYAHLQQALRGW